MRRTCGCSSKQHIKLTKKRLGQVTGIKSRLCASAAYPPRLGTAVIAAWEAGPEPVKLGRKSKGQRRRLLRKSYAATSSASHGLLSDQISEAGLSASQKKHRRTLLRRSTSICSSNCGGLLCEGAAELGLSSSVQNISGLAGAGFSAPSPELCCESNAGSADGRCSASPSPISLGHDDVEQSSLHWLRI